MLKAQNQEYLAYLQGDPKFQALLEDIDQTDLFALNEVKRWTPKERISNKERIFDDGLHFGKSQVLSIFRGTLNE